MSLVVEDGTGIADAESYCTVAYADTYHSNLGNTAWAALSDAEKEQALRKATDYMVQVYGERWKGIRSYPLTQRLDWPRGWAVVDLVGVGFDSVPDDVQRACASLALRASSATLAPDVKQQKESISVAGAVTVKFKTGAPPYTVYREIDNLLAKYLVTGGSGIKVSRA